MAILIRVLPLSGFQWGTGGGLPATPAGGGGFRSFQSVWFGPDGGAGGGVTPPTPVTSGRKLISQGFAATLNGELT